VIGGREEALFGEENVKEGVREVVDGWDQSVF
jgi:hypothetical protein